MTVHQVSGTVNLSSGSALGPAMVDVSVYLKIAESDEYKEVGRAQLIGTPIDGGEGPGALTIEPAAVPVLLRAIADKYDEALAPAVAIPETQPIDTAP
jgi:hypothetical protein